MKIETKNLFLEYNSPILSIDFLKQTIEDIKNEYNLLRWGIVSFNPPELIIEIITSEHDYSDQLINNITVKAVSDKFNVVFIIPTGVGANIGGYIGDAAPYVKLLSEFCDNVIINPNVVNAADLIGISDNNLYLEGFLLDNFLIGNIAINYLKNPQIGVVIDKLPYNKHNLVINALNSVVATKGINIIGYAQTNEKISSIVNKTAQGHFQGRLLNPQCLLDAANKLIAKGANSIAIITEIDGITKNDWRNHYLNGQPNPIGAIESLISRYLTAETKIPCVHAPVSTDFYDEVELFDPRVSAEVISKTGIPCILEGLKNSVSISVGLDIKDISAIVIPGGCVGGIPLLSAFENNIPILAIKENSCVVGLKSSQINMNNLIELDTYSDAVTYLLALKSKISWKSIHRPLNSIEQIL